MALLPQWAFAKGEVAPALYGRVDTAMYHTALATARNVTIRPYGGATNRAGLQFVGFCTSMSGRSRLRRFRFNTTDTYILEFSNLKMRVIRNDAFVLEDAKVIVAAPPSYPALLTVTAHGWAAGDDIEISGAQARYEGRRFRVLTVPSADTVRLGDILTGSWLDANAFGAYAGGGTAARVYTLATPYLEADLDRLKFSQTADVVTITHPDYQVRELSRSGHASWSLDIPAFVPLLDAPANIGLVVNTTGSTGVAYTVTAIADGTFEESLPGTPVSANNSADIATDIPNNTITWDAVPGALKYTVYKASNGVYGFMGETPDLVFNDVDNHLPDVNITPPGAANPFASDNNPGASSFYEQRRVFGGSTANPDTSYYTQTGNYHNFNKSSPIQADDAITATLTSREVNEIRHFVPGNDLLVFTAGSEWRVNSGQDNGFSAATIRQKPQSSWGSSHLEPIVLGQTTLFVPENQVSVRSFGYTYTSDSYTGSDLTLLASHLLADTPLTAWAMARSPDPIIYGVRSDGVATALTFQEEQQVVAWAHWDTAGSFESVDVIRPSSDDPDDVPYFVVKRTVGSLTVRYVERLHGSHYDDVRDCFFVDSGLSYDNPVAIQQIVGDGAYAFINTITPHGLQVGDEVDFSGQVWTPTVDEFDNETQPDQLSNRYTVAQVSTANDFAFAVDTTGWVAPLFEGYVRKAVLTVGGLDHLEGRAVVALADGNAFLDNLTVANGSITLQRKASRVHVGLKYVSDIETLNIEAPQGTIQGKRKKISSVTVRFLKSRGLLIGKDTSSLEEVRQREFEPYGAPTALLTGDKTLTLGSDWADNGRLFLRQRYPLPMNILAIVPDVAVED